MTPVSGALDHVRRQKMWLAACLAVLALQILAEFSMGRSAICECGFVKLWEGAVQSNGNSQHVSDWYSFSHLIHGFLFYAVAHFALRGKPFVAKLFLAVVLESGWEILENTPFAIEHYRNATMSKDYAGDSILNSVMDTGFMVLGFCLAARFPVWLIVSTAVFLEIFTGVMIRDNLTLNIVMLIWPIDAIEAWQQAL